MVKETLKVENVHCEGRATQKKQKTSNKKSEQRCDLPEFASEMTTKPAVRGVLGWLACGAGLAGLAALTSQESSDCSRLSLEASCEGFLGRLTLGTVGLVPLSWRLPTLPQLRTNRLGDPLRIITIKSVTQNPSSQPQRNSVGEVQTCASFFCAC